ncbi:MAG: glycosyltransferase family 2 protein [Chitinophagaceae bacterium]|nr:glycosyltransferase family 2 protein [Chitinophagaceae bacterium]
MSVEQLHQLDWIGKIPPSNRIALLVPQYNEASNCNILERLSYFKGIALKFKNELDVIIIDDGSTDNSLAIIETFQQNNYYPFYIASISPNSNKVGALHLTASAISHEYVVLSDFDTDIAGYERIFENLNGYEKNLLSKGYYFRLLPFEGQGMVFEFQQMEYSILRSYYKFYEKEGCVPVMPGAGACYQRAFLLSIYANHSGLRNGEDREATVIGLKMGFRTYYLKDVLSLTRPPLSLKKLVKQRIRWNLGYIETYTKEFKYYFNQVKSFNTMGIVLMLDFLIVILMILFPLIVVILGSISITSLAIFLFFSYMVSVLTCIFSVFLAKQEFTEMRKKIIVNILTYPFFKIFVGCVAWNKALLLYLKRSRKKP